jgi:CheY-like chemotaxis protein
MSNPAARAILLVEDNPADVYLIHTALQECGGDIHLSIVPNGRHALAFLRQEGAYALEPAPALILLDLSLPHLSGDTILVELRHLPAYETTPVIIFSAARKDLEEPRCLHLGATAYVQKPTDFDGFLTTIKSIVKTWLPPSSS